MNEYITEQIIQWNLTPLNISLAVVSLHFVFPSSYLLENNSLDSFDIYLSQKSQNLHKITYVSKFIFSSPRSQYIDEL